MVRSATAAGAMPGVTGAIRVRDAVKIRVIIGVNSTQNTIFASLCGSDPPPPVSLILTPLDGPADPAGCSDDAS